MRDGFGEKTYYGSLRDIEERLGLPRYRMGLYADYTEIQEWVIRRDCRWI